MGKAWQRAEDGEGGRAAAAARHVPSGFAACNPCNKNSSVPLEFVHPSHFPLFYLSFLLTISFSHYLSRRLSLSSITQESHLILIRF